MKTTVKKEPCYITDKKGKKLSVVISIDEYNQMIEELEELEDIRLYDAVKAKKEKSIPFEQYLQQRSRKKKNA
jgi:PHD/YefM family antitoxin component YafN of YafNO toxin-antitoxin module